MPTKYRIKGSPFWYVSYVGPDGKRVQKSLKTRDERTAQEKLNELNYHRDRESLGLPMAPAKLSIETAISEYLLHCKANHAEKTYKVDDLALRYLKGLCDESGIQAVSQITPSLFDRYKIMRRDAGIEPASVNRELGVHVAFLNKLAAEGKILRNPIKDAAGNTILKKLRITDKKIRFLSHQEIRSILEIEKRPRWASIIGFGLNTGMRPGEILNLTWPNVDLAGGWVTVAEEGAFRPKTRRSRRVPLGKAAMGILGSIKQQGPYVFGVQKGARPFVNNVDREFKRILRRAKVEECGLNVLRHTFASHFLMQTKDLKALQEILGHSRIETTMVYAHLLEDHKKQAIELLAF